MVTTSFEHGVFGHIPPLPGYADVFKKQFNYKLGATYLPKKVNLYENAPSPSLIDTPVLG